MSENITNTTGETGNDTTPAAEAKTFSQDDVNRIVSERLSKEKAKTDAAIAQREQELAQRELSITAKERLASKGLPADLLGALNMSSPEALEQSISILANVFEKNQNTPTQPAFRGLVPGAGANPPPPPDTDSGIRCAMGLK